MSRNRFFRTSALIGMIAVNSLTGCGEGVLDPTASAQYALTGHVTPLYGSNTGTYESVTGSSHQTTVTKIVGYGSTDNVYGIKLYWGPGTSKMFGVTNGSSAQNFDVTGDPVMKVEYSVSSGNLRGVKFTNSTSSLSIGNMSGGATSFNDLDAEFTDVKTWKSLVNDKMVICGFKLYYKSP